MTTNGYRTYAEIINGGRLLSVAPISHGQGSGIEGPIIIMIIGL